MYKYIHINTHISRSYFVDTHIITWRKIDIYRYKYAFMKIIAGTHNINCNMEKGRHLQREDSTKERLHNSQVARMPRNIQFKSGIRSHGKSRNVDRFFAVHFFNLQ